jgi:hypothetical protein
VQLEGLKIPEVSFVSTHPRRAKDTALQNFHFWRSQKDNPILVIEGAEEGENLKASFG